MKTVKVTDRKSSSGDAKPRFSTTGAAKRQDPLDGDQQELKRKSVLAWKAGGTLKDVEAGLYLTNEQVVHALQAKIVKSVEVARRYRRVLWYSLFVAVYLTVLYLQASAYKSGEVVSTLRNALMEDGRLSMTFNSEEEVLAYLGTKVLLPTWKDPVCGDGQCESPWEIKAFGRFGCLSDCGAETNTTKIAINMRADFSGHPNISPRVLMSSVRWNLCLNDPDRTARGEADLCWWEEDQTFSDIKVNRIESAEIIDGVWYLVIKGDYTGRVKGTVYDLTDPEVPVAIQLEAKWEKCRLPSSTTTEVATATRKLRSLFTKYTEERGTGNEDPELLQKLRADIFPELPPLNQTLLAERRQQVLEHQSEHTATGNTITPGELGIVDED